MASSSSTLLAAVCLSRLFVLAAVAISCSSRSLNDNAARTSSVPRTGKISLPSSKNESSPSHQSLRMGAPHPPSQLTQPLFRRPASIPTLSAPVRLCSSEQDRISPNLPEEDKGPVFPNVESQVSPVYRDHKRL